ncbi:hypothetical protein D3C76_1420110 [compost metagenome]
MRQAAREPSGQHKSKQQSEQRQNRSLEQDFLLALAECLVGQSDDHAAQVVLFRHVGGGFAALEKIVVQSDPLQPHRGLEHFDLFWAIVLFRGLLDIHQHPVGAVLNFQKAHIGRSQCRLEQAFEHFAVA